MGYSVEFTKKIGSCILAIALASSIAFPTTALAYEAEGIAGSTATMAGASASTDADQPVDADRADQLDDATRSDAVVQTDDSAQLNDAALGDTAGSSDASGSNGSSGSEDADGPATGMITVLHTNDIHGYYTPVKAARARATISSKAARNRRPGAAAARRRRRPRQGAQAAEHARAHR